VRTQFGFTRSVCACRACTLNCEHIPGSLVPDDVERMAKALGYTDVAKFARENLLASKGAKVMNLNTREVYYIPTIVPQVKADGSCKFLTADKKCSIHEVAPWGCAFFDVHEDDGTAHHKSAVSLRVIQENHQREGDYSLLWFYLLSLGLKAPPLEEQRANLHRALVKEGLL
jgi:Fe-S-cluster containining protein